MFCGWTFLFNNVIAQQLPKCISEVGLLAWYSLDGDAIDASQNHNDGVLYGPTSSIDRFGRDYSCLDFDGINDYIRVPNSSTLNAESITIAGWFNNKSESTNSTDGAQSLFAKWFYEINCGSYSDTYTVLLVNPNGQNKLLGAVPNYNLVNGAIQSNINISTNEWHSFVFIHDKAAGGQLYVDCELVGSNIIDGSICNTTNSLFIGADSKFGSIWRHFKGKIDDIGIWNRPLNDCEKLYYCGQDCNIGILTGADKICKGESYHAKVDLNLGFLTAKSYKWVLNGKTLTDDKSSIFLLPEMIENANELCVEVNNDCGVFTLCKTFVLEQTSEKYISKAICEGESFLNQNRTGIYSFVFQNSIGCDSTVYLDLTVNKVYQIDRKINLCPDSSFFLIDTLINHKGVYNRHLKTSLGCDSLIVFDVQVEKNNFLGKDTTICDGSQFTITSKYQNTYWPNGDISEKYTTGQNDIIAAQATSSFGCVLKDTIKVNFLKGIVLPNIFSPNGDNINDYFPGYNFSIPPYNLEIYDRWGELIFKGDHDWDGNFKGINAATGVYPFIFETTSGCEIKFVGNLLLIR